jgi:hypothetical protein
MALSVSDISIIAPNESLIITNFALHVQIPSPSLMTKQSVTVRQLTTLVSHSATQMFLTVPTTTQKEINVQIAIATITGMEISVFLMCLIVLHMVKTA